MMTRKPTHSHCAALAQLCERIPPFLAAKLARKNGVHAKVRNFSPWAHVAASLYAQLVHAISLNDVRDGLRLFRLTRALVWDDLALGALL